MKFWNLRQSMDDPADGVLDIDGEIVVEPGWFTPDGAIIAKNFRKALQGVKNVTVRINSPGGDVMGGSEIYSALREHSMNGEGRIKVVITALAASAASVIAMAGDEIAMYPTSYMMIHNPWSIAAGDAREMRKTARVLDEIGEGLINAYQTRTGLERDELKKMLNEETWMSAGTCLEKGFCDSIIGSGSQAAAMCCMSAKAHGAGEIAARIREDAGHDETDARSCYTEGRSSSEIWADGRRYRIGPMMAVGLPAPMNIGKKTEAPGLKDWQKEAMADNNGPDSETAEQDEDRKRRELLAWAVTAAAEE